VGGGRRPGVGGLVGGRGRALQVVRLGGHVRVLHRSALGGRRQALERGAVLPDDRTLETHGGGQPAAGALLRGLEQTLVPPLAGGSFQRPWDGERNTGSAPTA